MKINTLQVEMERDGRGIERRREIESKRDRKKCRITQIEKESKKEGNRKEM